MAQYLSTVFDAGQAAVLPLRVRMEEKVFDDTTDTQIGKIRKASFENEGSEEQPESLDGRQLTPRSPSSELNSSGHSSEPEDDVEVLHGYFKVEEVALTRFKGVLYVSIQLTDPNIDDQKWLHTKGYRECLEICGQCSDLQRIPLSIVLKAIGNHETAEKPIEIKWEWRVLNLTFVEKGGLSKAQLLDQIAKNVLIEDIAEDDQEFLRTTHQSG